jgi:signal transduction histidine kinase
LVKINMQTEKKLIDLNLSLLKSNEELQKTNSELDSFVYRASHDIRSPISTAKGLITISKNETDIEQIKVYLDLQEKSLNKLESFVTAILDHSRNSRGEIALKPIYFDQLIDEIIQYTFPQSLIESCSCVIEISDDLFYSDPDRIHTVFINLIGNAVKYLDKSKPRFELFIKVEKVGHNIEIRIQDNGIGIPADLQPRIFEMFFRATQISTGSGLGLYIVKEAVQKMDGIISVNSQMGQGTCFNIILPYKKPLDEQQSS